MIDYHTVFQKFVTTTPFPKIETSFSKNSKLVSLCQQIHFFLLKNESNLPLMVFNKTHIISEKFVLEIDF